MAAASYRARKMAGEKDQCAYCGGTYMLSVDHKIPRSRGGGDTSDNLHIVCKTCNSMKRNRTPEEFEVYLKQKWGGIHDGHFHRRKKKLDNDKWVDRVLLGIN